MSGLALANPRVQRLRRLFGRRSFRVSEGVFVVEGAKVLAEAFDAGAVVEALYVVSGTRDAVIDRAVAGGVRVFELAVGVMEKVSDTVSPQPVLGVVGYSGFVLDDLRTGLSGGGFVVVGVELQDPGNAGTVIRSAEGAGAAGVVLCDGSVEATNPKPGGVGVRLVISGAGK